MARWKENTAAEFQFAFLRMRQEKAYGENNYSGLAVSYFSNDLQMVKKWMESEAVYLETVDEN